MPKSLPLFIYLSFPFLGVCIFFILFIYSINSSYTILYYEYKLNTAISLLCLGSRSIYEKFHKDVEALKSSMSDARIVLPVKHSLKKLSEGF